MDRLRFEPVLQERRQLEDHVVVRDQASIGNKQRFPAPAGGPMVFVVPASHCYPTAKSAGQRGP